MSKRKRGWQRRAYTWRATTTAEQNYFILKRVLFGYKRLLEFEVENDQKASLSIVKKSLIKTLPRIFRKFLSHLFFFQLSLHVVESKIYAFFFSIDIMTNTGTCIMYHNQSGPQWITSLLLNIVTVCLNSNVPHPNESMYAYLKKLC